MADPRRAPDQSECIGSVTDEGLSIRVYARKQNAGTFEYFFEPSRVTQALYGGRSRDGFFPEADWSRIVDLTADARRFVEEHRQSHRLATGQEPERRGEGTRTDTSEQSKGQTQTRKPRQQQSL
jgi:hypothetical protein